MDDRLKSLGLPRVPNFAEIIPRFDPPVMPPEIRVPSAFENQLRANQIALRPLIQEQSENLTAAIHDRITKLQAGLQADEELVVYCGVAPDSFRVTSFEFPEWNVAIVSGVDAGGFKTLRICHVQMIQITCKIVKIAPGTKKTVIGFIWPKGKE